MAFYYLAAQRGRRQGRWAAESWPAAFWGLAAYLLWRRDRPEPGISAESITWADALIAALAAVAAALAARMLATWLEGLWLGVRCERLLAGLARRRRERWFTERDLAKAADEARDREKFQWHTARRNRISLAVPCRATWMGDRTAALEQRVHGEYGLDFAAAWPRLLLIVPQERREPAATAAAAWYRATVWAAWGVVLAALAPLWPPALAAGLLPVLWAVNRGRAAAGAFTDLAEALIDLHAVDLAAALCLPAPEGLVTPELGRQITARLRKGV